MPEKPVLFATPASQHYLIEAYRLAETKGTSKWHYDETGIVYLRADRASYVLDPRHPGAGLIRSLLAWLCEDEVRAPIARGPGIMPLQRLAYERPLGHQGTTPFRLLLALARADRESFNALKHQVADRNGAAVESSLRTLIKSESVVESETQYTINPIIPDEFRQLILVLGDYAAERDSIYSPTKNHLLIRPSGYTKARDDAPRIFGTDLRLRSLMALATNGPLTNNELRRATGCQGKLVETKDNSPFTRASLVRQWQTDEGLITALDPNHPNAYALQRYLVAIESAFPLSPLKENRPTRLLPPPSENWDGDRSALFGSPIPTKVLVSIGELGWTFEALCVELCTGHYREVVKAAIHRLEDDGILQGDRPRRPGPNVRVLTLASTLPAKAFLADLLRDAADAWPSFRSTVISTMNGFTPKSMEHLRRRGLWPARPSGSQADERRSSIRDDGSRTFTVFGGRVASAPESVEDAERKDAANRKECIEQYKALVARRGRALTSDDLRVGDDLKLYRRIKRLWPGFAAFRKDALLPSRYQRRGTAVQRRQRCIGDYESLSAKLGHAPNTSELVRIDSMLRERIVAEWGSFDEFVYEQKPVLSRHHRSPKLPDEIKRQRIVEEYEDLSTRLGLVPNTAHLKAHTDGLYKRILKSYGSFTNFREIRKRSCDTGTVDG